MLATRFSVPTLQAWRLAALQEQNTWGTEAEPAPAHLDQLRCRAFWRTAQFPIAALSRTARSCGSALAGPLTAMALTIGDAVPDFVAASTKGEIHFHKVRPGRMLSCHGGPESFADRTPRPACRKRPPLRSFWTMDQDGPCFCECKINVRRAPGSASVFGLRATYLSCQPPCALSLLPAF